MDIPITKKQQNKETRNNGNIKRHIRTNYDKNKYITGTEYKRVRPYLDTPVKAIRNSMGDIVIELEPTTTTEGIIKEKE